MKNKIYAFALATVLGLCALAYAGTQTFGGITFDSTTGPTASYSQNGFAGPDWGNTNSGASTRSGIKLTNDLGSYETLWLYGGTSFYDGSVWLRNTGGGAGTYDGVLYLGSGSGSGVGNVVINPKGTSAWFFNGHTTGGATVGHMCAQTDNTYDIGSRDGGTTSLRPRTIYVGTAVAGTYGSFVPGTGYMRVGSTTQASNLGDFASGTSSAQAMTWNNSTQEFKLYDDTGTSVFEVDNGIVETFQRRVENVTADQTLTVDESNKLITNLGDTANHTQTLPTTAEAGISYTFFVSASWQLRIDPATNDKIICHGLSGLADGEYMWSSSIGSTVTLTRQSDGDWLVTSFNGSWAEQTP